MEGLALASLLELLSSSTSEAETVARELEAGSSEGLHLVALLEQLRSGSGES
ncbi:hypothetical protein [Nocardia sp. GTS18]|uniref:hypothetical protein n=1 Tax=Nocardia sp. GTS18 TaxID=1778064 RepID=UPI0015EE4E01|nr:hypothetical protein [Nocardia sp. GTS18]